MPIGECLRGGPSGQGDPDGGKEAGREQVGHAQIQIAPAPKLGNVVIEAKDLSKGFGDRLLIEDLSFSLPRAGIVGVIGGIDGSLVSEVASLKSSVVRFSKCHIRRSVQCKYGVESWVLA